MGEDRLRQAVLTGSAAQRWPLDGCRCPCCTLATGNGSPASLRPAWGRLRGLRLPGALTLDGDPTEADPALPRLTTSRTEIPGVQWLAAGECAELGGVRVVALPAGGTDGEPDADRVVLVLGCGTQALLWAAGSGPLPAITLEALAGAELTAAVLDTGTALEAGPDAATGPGLGLAHEVARLRAAGALADDARLVATGLSHTGPAPHRLAGLAEAWGVDVLPDGTPLWPSPTPPTERGETAAVPAETSASPAETAAVRAETAAVRAGTVQSGGPRRERAGQVAPATRTVVLGATASGKSLVAESLLAALPEVVYVATGPQPDDADTAWASRVAEHRRRRPTWWRTVEGGDLVDLLARPGPALLVDSLGTWLSTAMTDVGCWGERPGWQDRLQRRMDALVTAWRQAARPVVAVVEEVGWGVVPVTAAGGHFRDMLGSLSRRVCDQSERVLLVVAGHPVDLDALAGGGRGHAAVRVQP
jgi:adenosylcobinamide kinase/adenosylcobinamide-phosphate guanylyltransferase